MGWTTYQLVQDLFHQQYHMYTDEKCFERGERDIFNKIVARLYMGNLALSRNNFAHWKDKMLPEVVCKLGV